MTASFRALPDSRLILSIIYLQTQAVSAENGLNIVILDCLEHVQKKHARTKHGGTPPKPQEVRCKKQDRPFGSLIGSAGTVPSISFNYSDAKSAIVLHRIGEVLGRLKLFCRDITCRCAEQGRGTILLLRADAKGCSCDCLLCGRVIPSRGRFLQLVHELFLDWQTFPALVG